MFTGEYNHAIDDKGRTIVPSKFREQLGEGFVVTKGFDGCLFVYPLDEWDKLVAKMSESTMTTKDARKFLRFFFGSASQCDFDKQGRINIPAPLREYAGLEKDIVSVGVLNRIEIWDKTRWTDSSSYDDMELVGEKMAELGIMI